MVLQAAKGINQNTQEDLHFLSKYCQSCSAVFNQPETSAPWVPLAQGNKAATTEVQWALWECTFPLGVASKGGSALQVACAESPAQLACGCQPA